MRTTMRYLTLVGPALIIGGGGGMHGGGGHR